MSNTRLLNASEKEIVRDILADCEQVYIKFKMSIKYNNNKTDNAYLILTRKRNGIRSEEYLIQVYEKTFIELFKDSVDGNSIKHKNYVIKEGVLYLLNTVEKTEVELKSGIKVGEFVYIVPETVEVSLWDILTELSELDAMQLYDGSLEYMQNISNMKFSNSTLTVYNSFHTREGWKSKKIVWFSNEFEFENMLVLIEKEKYTDKLEAKLGAALVKKDFVKIVYKEFVYLEIDTSKLPLVIKGKQEALFTYCKEKLILDVYKEELEKAMSKGLHAARYVVEHMLGKEKGIKETDGLRHKLVQTKNLILKLENVHVPNNPTVYFECTQGDVLPLLEDFISNRNNVSVRNKLKETLTEKLVDSPYVRAFVAGFLIGMRLEDENNFDYEYFKLTKNAHNKRHLVSKINRYIERLNIFIYDLNIVEGHAKQFHLVGGESRHALKVTKEGY